MNAYSDPPAPRRILMTTDTVGGVWNYALELCRGFAGPGVRVLLATMGRSMNAEQRRQIATLPNVEPAESVYKLEWMADPWAEVDAAGDWLLQLDERFRPDVVHLNGFSHGALPFSAPKLVVGHSCVLSWWRAVKGVDAPSEWNEYARRVRLGLQGANLVVAPTRAMLTSLVDHYGPLHHVAVIRNGSDPARFTPGPKEPFIVSAGRLWDEAKNVSALTNVASHLPWPVWLAGEEAGTKGSPACLPRVRTLGQLGTEELASWYRRAAIYAAPARYEPFGLSILEAALSGCALVLGDVPSLRELWGDAAMFVPPDDAAALCKSLVDLVDDETRRVALATRARERAMDFTPLFMVRAYWGAYYDLMRGESRVAGAREDAIPAEPVSSSIQQHQLENARHLMPVERNA